MLYLEIVIQLCLCNFIFICERHLSVLLVCSALWRTNRFYTQLCTLGMRYVELQFYTVTFGGLVHRSIHVKDGNVYRVYDQVYCRPCTNFDTISSPSKRVPFCMQPSILQPIDHRSPYIFELSSVTPDSTACTSAMRCLREFYAGVIITTCSERSSSANGSENLVSPMPSFGPQCNTCGT